MEREKRIASILENANTTGFTELLKGDRIKRHVVAFTDNGEWSIELLAAQASFFWMAYENLTIGWRTYPNWRVVIDIWTSTDILSDALRLKQQHAQYAIWDTVEERSIEEG